MQPAFAQGTILFANLKGLDARVTDCNQLPLSGSQFMAGLFAPVDAQGNISTNFTFYTPGCSTVGSPNNCPVGTGLAVGPTGKVVMAYESRYADYQQPHYLHQLWEYD